MINPPTGRSIDIYCSPVGDIDIIELMKKYIKILGKVRPTVDGDWSKDKSYDILTIVYDKDSKKSYISRKKVPVGINILNKDYWMNISTTRVDNDSIVLLSNPNDIGQINSFTLQEAVDSFNNEDKRIGLFISFYEKPVHELDTYKWNLYQFIGNDINQFNDITKWISIYNRSNKFLGLYLTEGKLNEVKRSPEVGDYAFVGNTLKEAIIYRCNVNGKWTKTKESAVDYIELKLSGNVTVGENGNWFNDGVDTGFKAKGEDGKTPQIVVSKDNKLQVSYDGINFTNITENIVYTQYRVSGNKLQYSIDLGKTWNDASGFISANFRWKSTNIAAGKIQISRENEVWEDLSPEFVSNSADEEDLESVIIGDNNRVIREKSVKEYNPAEFSGLGRVILRKNIVQEKNILTQEMINKPNTIYEIRYDFDLNDATINIPENCTLDFQGGTLNNGTINFNSTHLLGNPIINTDVSGNLDCEVNISFFGADRKGIIDSSKVIQKLLNAFGEIYIPKGIFLINNQILLSRKINIHGDGESSILNCRYNDAIFLFSPEEGNNYIDITISRIKAIGTLSSYFDGFNDINNKSIFLKITNTYTFPLFIDNCIFDRFKTALYIDNAFWNRVHQCKFTSCNNAISVSQCNSSSFTNNIFIFLFNAGIEFRTNINDENGYISTGINISGNDFSAIDKAGIVVLTQLNLTSIQGNYFEKQDNHNLGNSNTEIIVGDKTKVFTHKPSLNGCVIKANSGLFAPRGIYLYNAELNNNDIYGHIVLDEKSTGENNIGRIEDKKTTKYFSEAYVYKDKYRFGYPENLENEIFTERFNNICIKAHSSIELGVIPAKIIKLIMFNCSDYDITLIMKTVEDNPIYICGSIEKGQINMEDENKIWGDDIIDLKSIKSVSVLLNNTSTENKNVDVIIKYLSHLYN